MASANNLAVHGSTGISMHERFTNLKKTGEVGLAVTRRSRGYDSVGSDEVLRGNHRIASPPPGSRFRTRNDSTDRSEHLYSYDRRRRCSSPSPMVHVHDPVYDTVYDPVYEPVYDRVYNRHPPLTRMDDDGHRGYRHEPGSRAAPPHDFLDRAGFVIPRRNLAVESALQIKARSLKHRLGTGPGNGGFRDKGGYYGVPAYRHDDGFRKGYQGYRPYFRGRGSFRRSGGFRGGYGRFTRSGRWPGPWEGREDVGGWESNTSFSRDGTGAKKFSDGLLRNGVRGTGSFSFRGWSRGGTVRRRSMEAPPTKEELDSQLDSYMAATKTVGQTV